MTNLSSSDRSIRRRCTAGFVVAGAGAAFIGLAASQLAHADSGAYTDISNIYNDALVYDNFYGPLEDAQFYSDLTSPGNTVTALGILGGLATPPGSDASADVNATAAEGSSITSQLTELHSLAATDAADFHEFPVIGDILDFQQQINNSIADLPAITAHDETNPLLVADLAALYGYETDLDNTLVNLDYELTADSPAGITSDNAVIIADALTMANDAQSASETLTFLADLSSLGL